MELKGAELRNLTKLCLPMPQNGCDKMPLKVCIPYYQRPYKWDEQKIKNLFVDYFKNAESEKPEEAEEYFVGSVVMVEKKDGGSHMYSLNDFKIHNTINIENGYMEGRYGAIPFIGQLNM